jgi:alpha-L-fucosidase 2
MRFLTYLLLPIAISMSASAQNNLRLWYEMPAAQWEETLPLGNGRLGMTPDGGVRQERIVLNDITLWSGSPQDANNYEANQKLPEIRRLIAEGRNDEAQSIIHKDFICKGRGSGEGDGANVPFGCYQVLGNLRLQFEYAGVAAGAEATDYIRALSLADATATCAYTLGGVKYTREYFTSFADDVNVIRLTASKAGALNFSIAIDRPERFAVTTEGGDLKMSGQLENGVDGKGMRYLAQVHVVVKGASITSSNKSLKIQNATEAIVYVSAATDYKDPGYTQKVVALLTKAQKRSYADQRKQHVANFQALFNRVSVSLGSTNKSSMPTDKRLEAYVQDPAADQAMAALYFQFGRYLTICSTRVGLLPPNLQGLWAEQIQTPWNGDYHLDINVQMNHWPVEVCNLPELSLPLAELVRGMVPYGERTARAYYNGEGWVAHVITNIWGYTEPGESASWGVTKCGSGWLCNNLWEHYLFTLDEDYLRSIYPILKGAAQFYNSILVRDAETGWLVTSPSSSPEHGFYMPNGNHVSICMGPTIDTQIMRELFSNVIVAARKLGQDEALATEFEERLQQLPPVGQIGSDGRVMEWLKEYRELEPQHRCISHLYGLFPAPLITPDKTPELAAASRKTLEVRGDDGPSFSIAHKMLWWARLHDGNRAYKLFNDMIRLTRKTNMNYGAGGGIYPNMLSAGPPFQIDGNFGATAGLAEMLIQSHEGYIDLLPAIPDPWREGTVKGLKARGNFTVDIQWKDGRVTGYTIKSPQVQKVKVKVNGAVVEVKTTKIAS